MNDTISDCTFHVDDMSDQQIDSLVMKHGSLERDLMYAVNILGKVFVTVVIGESTTIFNVIFRIPCFSLDAASRKEEERNIWKGLQGIDDKIAKGEKVSAISCFVIRVR